MTPDEKFRSLLESAPDAIVIVNEEGAIEIVNGQAESLFGYQRSELLGAGVEILVPTELREAHLGHRGRYQADPRTRPMGIGMDLVGQRKDGSRFPVEISLSPLQTEDGVLITSVIRDISDRKAAKRALRDSEQRFRELVEGTDDLVVRLDFEGRFIYLNRTAGSMLGRSPEECAGLSWFDFVHPDDRLEAEAAFERLASERSGGTTLENRQLGPDGAVNHLMWTVNPRYDARGALTSVMAIGRDLTDRKRLDRVRREAIEARAELKAKRVESEMRGEILRRSIGAQEDERRRIARELHDETAQALTGVLLGIGQLESKAEDEAVRSSAAELGEQVAETLRELRRIAMSLRPTVLDDFGLVAAVEHLSKQRPPGEETRISFECAAMEHRFESAVETAIYRILQEAVTNAARHAEASEIRIELGEEDRMLIASVSDDGRGFDPDAPRGEGLGLAGMRERAELLVGGSLTVTSEAGKGTKVVLRLPSDQAIAGAGAKASIDDSEGEPDE